MKVINDEKLLKEYMDGCDFRSFFDQDISGSTVLIHYESGEYLIKNGTVSEYLLFMVKGECRFFTFSDEGVYVSFGSASSFQVFGEVSSLWGLPAGNAVQAVRSTYCLGIDLQEHREDLLGDNAFLRYVCRLLSERVLVSNRSLTSYIGGKAESRLAKYIMQNSSEKIFNVRLTRCSEAIGVSYRHLLRLMKYLCREQILEKKGRRYRIVDIRKLSGLSCPAGR